MRDSIWSSCAEWLSDMCHLAPSEDAVVGYDLCGESLRGWGTRGHYGTPTAARATSTIRLGDRDELSREFPTLGPLAAPRCATGVGRGEFCAAARSDGRLGPVW